MVVKIISVSSNLKKPLYLYFKQISAALHILRSCFIYVFCCFASVINAGVIEMPEVVESSSLHGASVYENINIPSIRFRNPDSDTGPLLWVKEIRLQGIAISFDSTKISQPFS